MTRAPASSAVDFPLGVHFDKRLEPLRPRARGGTQPLVRERPDDEQHRGGSAVRASTIWSSSRKKSFRSRGTPAPRAAARRSSTEPPKNGPSVSTETAAAPCAA
jgi:hypothetical protein